ncbi:unnamed protein product [Sphagnum jensenii]|uniref:Methyltransferase type 11 domain-containing protein n=1 Tax=Sphagnum jensenii TaxID=128206 RepID=A0ABP1B359_9BRYO
MSHSLDLGIKLVVLVIIVVVNVLALIAFQGVSSWVHQIRSDLNSSTEEHELMGALRSDLRNAKSKLKHTMTQYQRLSVELSRVTASLHNCSTQEGAAAALIAKQEASRGELQEFVADRKFPLGWNPSLGTDSMMSSVGHGCLQAINGDELERFMSYEVGGLCPDDDNLAQQLLLKGCEPLPRRRCFARGFNNFSDPVPFPQSMWTMPPDGSINWSAYSCKSLECLNRRAQQKVFADCLDCFDLQGREKHRWVRVSPSSIDFTIEEVLLLATKNNGSVRIGLDIGGGTGTFAARMSEYNVTIITSTLNLGGPFNNFIAHRGLMPLFVSIAQRLPFWDNTLDMVHSMHVLSNWIPTETLSFIIYDIDRVLRPGGLFWLDHFFCIRPQLEEVYIPMIQHLGYTKLKWEIGNKLDRGALLQEVYLSALLQKPTQARI